MKLSLPSEMKEIDKQTIGLGVPALLLMENAAGALVAELLNFSPKRVLLLCGKGNNGGDAYATGRLLLARGIEVNALSLGEPITKEARFNQRLFKAFGGKVYRYKKLTESRKKLIKEYDLILDGLFGVGFRGKLEKEIVSLIEYINSLQLKRVAIDIPSGVNGVNGSVNPVAFNAHVTVTFGLAKPGHFFFPGRNYVGSLRIAQIGFPEYILKKLSSIELIDDSLARELLPERPPWGHKGTFGRVCIVGGSPDYTGAVLLSALGSLRVGAGMIYTFTPKNAQSVVRNHLPEAIAIASKSNTLIPDDLNELIPLIEKTNALVIGPGIGRTEETQAFVRELLSNGKLDKLRSVVVDADALYAVSKWPEIIKGKKNFILTPHPGEFARLVDAGIEHVINNMNLIKAFAEENGVLIVLKGAVSIIATYSGNIWLNITGNTGLAKAGSGDLLSGTIAGFSAQGLESIDSLILGSYFMGKAAELSQKPESSLSPTIVAENYAEVFSYLQGSHNERVH
ncbi:bifunctional ADP-dependent NAD(P)H-hydrate dehydratase/NAD(P)H-hydrate epimerase [Kosmotoga pacifica]|uniref:Bifunctional NAD(P)H-hydrate repair enzyme n=1 Tax=Kosmotoga pacifica TaxID=1330330 RepID=A0A0G2ZEC8_9BACT|nr:bifunctional ADP-dependent NAD(P)H-hydrate dehydratase/NAD(P)H-hydrate epimerase [Kosmotoga pacifica]AKI97188.1 hypothetical protein IX53_04475 [Kosmotoga pacifica]